jgi:hypothetical protein
MRAAAMVSLLTLSAPALALAQEPSPLEWAQVTAPGRSVYTEIGEQGERMGTLRRGRPFPIYERANGPRCQAPWVRVGPRGWACSEDFTRADGPPPDDPGPPLPFRYVVTFRDTPVHHKPHKKAQTGQIRKQKSTLTVEEEQKDWVRVFPDEWFPRRALLPRPERELRLQGERLGESSAPPLAFARIKGVWVYPSPDLSKAAQKKLQKEGAQELRRFDRAPVLEVYPPGAKFGGAWLRLPQGWVQRHQVALVELQARPNGVEADEQWIVIDLSEQTLVAYEGDKAVFATLVSTGKAQGRGGEDTQTPTGRWRIQHKLRSTKMAGGEGASYHWLSDVPWVQYFHLGYAIHGAFWHNSFGWVQSQGCVNLTPADAQWLFFWTRPTLSSGWYTALSQPEHRPAWVIVQR